MEENKEQNLSQQPVQPVENQTVQASPTAKSRLPVILIVIFVLLIILSSGGYYYIKNSNLKSQKSNPPASQRDEQLKSQNLTPTQVSDPTPATDPTANPDQIGANWKTYVNKKYGYSIKYENDPRLKEFTCAKKPPEKGDDTFVLDEADSTFPECGAGGYSWPISIEVSTEPIELDCKSTESWSATETELIISGITATKCNQKFIGKNKVIPGPDEIARVTISRNNKVFSLHLSNIKYSKTFDQILSTFKFTDQISTTPNPSCGTCPQRVPPHPDFCKGGTIISGGKNACGCYLPPICKR